MGGALAPTSGDEGEQPAANLIDDDALGYRPKCTPIPGLLGRGRTRKAAPCPSSDRTMVGEKLPLHKPPERGDPHPQAADGWCNRAGLQQLLSSAITGSNRQWSKRLLTVF